MCYTLLCTVACSSVSDAVRSKKHLPESSSSGTSLSVRGDFPGKKSENVTL
jgi:hypothetical protein